jgi:hypothetical protein
MTDESDHWDCTPDELAEPHDSECDCEACELERVEDAQDAAERSGKESEDAT